MNNILIVSNTLCFGGAESFSAQFFEQLDNKGDQVHYAIFSGNMDLLDRFPSIDKNRIHQFDNAPETGTIKMLTKIFKVKKYLKDNNIDTIYLSQPDSALVFWLLKIFNKKLKIIYITMHVYENSSSKEKKMWKTGLPNKGTDIFIGLSEYLSLQLKQKNQVDPSKVIINRLPVDIEKFNISDKKNRVKFDLPLDKKIVGICCRLFPVKRVDLFVEAFRHIKDEKIIGVIYGEGPEQDRLLEMIKKYNLSDKVILRPFIDNVNEVIPMFDLYLQTVDGPNLGLVTLEAFSSGVPVIMLADNEEERFMITDTYCNQNVGKISTTNPEDIASKVIEILNDPELDQMSVRCRKLAEENYSWPAFISVNDEILKKLK
ncbi:glycosyltransferase family 4 protein [Chryseobacterium sp. Mn2064]|uniref:glycosyltransferase family 4 protein n=1 Tax=Chryseobacterium sp. Mn2064 TaxID=3395263 RepID=UPI003BC9352C